MAKAPKHNGAVVEAGEKPAPAAVLKVTVLTEAEAAPYLDAGVGTAVSIASSPKGNIYTYMEARSELDALLKEKQK